jgi:microcystin-dependent protein
MADGYLGELRLVSFAFAPRNWALCQGQIMLVSENPALFGILGTNYGGDGVATFALPDLRGRAPVHDGGLVPGELGGVETVGLTLSEMPAHRHTLRGSQNHDTVTDPAGALLGVGGSYASAPDGTLMSPQSLRNRGAGHAHENMQPSLTMTWIICVSGIFPSGS